MSFDRFVAIGDSFTQGVGDADPARPQGWRGWADRVAEVLATHNPNFRYANLATSGAQTHHILGHQLEPALALRPDLVSVHAGGNDLIRPKVDIDKLVAGIGAAVDEFRAQGATVIMFTQGDGGSSGVFGAIRGRVAIFNELVRDFIADGPLGPEGIVLVDNWRLKDGHDLRVWADDRLHLNSIGHQGVAINVLNTLGIEHDLVPYALPDGPPKSRRQQRAEDLAWARNHLAPWVGRRLRRAAPDLTGAAKYPTLTPLA
ncbi:SGNH/GDSL hydrolase family protein [Nocardioides sp. Kera G14]|uniref:SGNH/GDSL hydrolase family protein n=1 Tax=Nocardioides sp. Kera G14 TaxID=2884264 RepID=UPI001D0FD3CF|nr:SGNH/GDSL hydrolase family protein [Nocardioides sp. Kera G14]UDY23229.1 SGNH/GDSL hydrolase family protein [Nocardioides sp. Kera G14]